MPEILQKRRKQIPRQIFKNRVLEKGYSLFSWTITFAVILSGLLFIRVPLQRALQSKVRATADYLLWSSLGSVPQQYKGEETVYSRDKVTQTQNTAVLEKKRDNKENPLTIEYRVEMSSRGEFASSSVEEGNEVLLGIFNLNNLSSNCHQR